MIESKANLFESIFDKEVDAICIATDDNPAMNGKQASICAKRWPRTTIRLAACLKNFGTNIPFIIGAVDKEFNYLEPTLKIIKDKKFKSLIFSFPTMNSALEGPKLEVVESSAKELKTLADRFELNKIVLSRINDLSWESVKPIFENYFDARFQIVSFAYEN